MIQPNSTLAKLAEDLTLPISAHLTRDCTAQVMALRAASPLRPVPGNTASTHGLALFDHTDAPRLL